MRRRVLEVELAGHASLIRGHGSREMYEQVVGRPPVWVASLRGWSAQESTARDVVALAEARDYDVLITGRRSRREQLLEVLIAAPLPRPLEDGRAGLPVDLDDPPDVARAPRRGRPPVAADPGRGLW